MLYICITYIIIYTNVFGHFVGLVLKGLNSYLAN